MMGKCVLFDHYVCSILSVGIIESVDGSAGTSVSHLVFSFVYFSSIPCMSRSQKAGQWCQ